MLINTCLLDIYSDISKIVKGSKNTILINATGVAFVQLLAEYQNLKTFVDQDLEIFDLRYKDNLEDQEYFNRLGIRYINGLEMNLIQAATAFANVYANGDTALADKINEIIKKYE
jgi:shikimate 5-dehydrogenase